MTQPPNLGCTRPSEGWYCSRQPGHDGPCAARKITPALSQAWVSRVTQPNAPDMNDPSATPEIPDEEPETLRETLIAGCILAESDAEIDDAWELMRGYIIRLETRYTEARDSRNALIRSLGESAYQSRTSEESTERGITKMTESKSDGINREDASLLLGVSTTKSTAPVTTAGRELDALVAEKVMGAKWVRDFGRQTGRGYYRLYLDHLVLAERYDGHDPVYAESPVLRRYSTSIADAWLVAEKLAPHYIQQAFSRNEIGHWEIDWCVSEESYRAGYRTVVDYASDYETESLPLAICLAALKAVGA